MIPAESATEGETITAVEVPVARLHGAPLLELPHDLYIPPQALAIFLEAFEGPLDLLLYLIRKQNLDILDIPIADVTRQYMAYVELMQELHLELAAEYLVMAALLAEIKSRMLLPRPPTASEEEADPRAELVRRLQQYEQFRQAALDLDNLPRAGRELFHGAVPVTDRQHHYPLPTVSLNELLQALAGVMRRSEMFASHQIAREPLSVRERMTQLLEQVRPDRFTEFTALFRLEEGRRGLVVTFMAVLELIKQSLLELVQAEPFAPIHVRARLSGADTLSAAATAV